MLLLLSRYSVNYKICICKVDCLTARVLCCYSEAAVARYVYICGNVDIKIILNRSRCYRCRRTGKRFAVYR